MADIKKGANEPFLYDDQTDRITGLKNSDATEKKFVYTDGSSGPATIVADTLTVGGVATFTGGATVRPNAVAATTNVVLGPNAGVVMQSGAANNVCIGQDAGDSITSGGDDVCIGSGAGAAITSANQCVFVGRSAGNSVTAGSATIIGATAGLNALTSASESIVLGRNSGRLTAAGATLTTITNSIFIGTSVRANANSQTNQIAIGHEAIGDGSNTTVIGNLSTTSTRLAGTATSQFFIDGDTMRITGTRTPASNAAGTAGDFTFGTDGATTYLYYCIASGNWGRVALTTGY